MNTVSPNIYADNAPKYFQRQLTVLPVWPDSKATKLKGWSGYGPINNFPREEKRDLWLHKYRDYGIGICVGTKLPDGTIFGALDIDDGRFESMVHALVGKAPCIKRGMKGGTIFVRAESDIKSTKPKPKGSNAPVEVFASSGFVTLPPTIHPDTKNPYVWEGIPLSEIEFEELPLLTKDMVKLLGLIVKSEHTEVILGGIGTHEAMLGLTAQGFHQYDTDDRLELILGALLPTVYEGNTLEELPEMLESARTKKLGSGLWGIKSTSSYVHHWC